MQGLCSVLSCFHHHAPCPFAAIPHKGKSAVTLSALLKVPSPDSVPWNPCSQTSVTSILGEKFLKGDSFSSAIWVPGNNGSVQICHPTFPNCFPFSSHLQTFNVSAVCRHSTHPLWASAQCDLGLCDPCFSLPCETGVTRAPPLLGGCIDLVTAAKYKTVIDM